MYIRLPGDLLIESDLLMQEIHGLFRVPRVTAFRLFLRPG